jgi:predicted methyltransferase
MDLHAAVNAISDVVQNRPRPMREFDQIYMKTGDMVLQSEIVARWANGKRLAFIGDGDAISVSVAYLQKRGILEFGPSKIVVFDFDQRICNAVLRFADKERLDTLDAELYNCIDAFPGPTTFDCFYTNPPWGASNNGESVKVFMQRGMEAAAFGGEGLVVIADDPNVEWTSQVLARVQAFAVESGYLVNEQMPQLHSYHLDDAPDLKSCNVFLRAVGGAPSLAPSRQISESGRLTNFYGRDNYPHVRYILERSRPDYGKAHTDEYELELLESADD